MSYLLLSKKPYIFLLFFPSYNEKLLKKLLALIFLVNMHIPEKLKCAEYSGDKILHWLK